MVSSSIVISNELSATKVKHLVDAFRHYCYNRRYIYKGTNNKHRTPNFPEDISENIIRQYIINMEKRHCIWNTRMGDLEIIEPGEPPSSIQVEVKCFASTGPLSFGPNERWDELYWLDATDLIAKDQVKIFHTKYAFESDVIKNIPVNKNETFFEQCRQKRRPRFTLHSLQRYHPSAVTQVYAGSLDGILHSINYAPCNSLHHANTHGIPGQFVQCRI